MKSKIVTFALVCASACLFLAPQAHAQCPAGNTNPLSVLVGKWTFDMDGVVPVGVPYAAAGQFTASIGTVPNTNPPVPIGRLVVTQSSSDGSRQEIDVGTYQVLGDCSGGTLTFNLSQRFLQFDFFFDENFGEIRFVATTSGVAVKGTAERF